MKLSIVIPTRRTSYSAMARVFECATLDSERFEVVVRNNAGDSAKQKWLGTLCSPTLRVFNVEDRGAFENSIEALRLATGDFILFLADDDWISVRGLQALHSLAYQYADEPAVSAVTGTYYLESSRAAGLFRYQDVDATDPVQRLNGYFAQAAPNVFFYSAVRRTVAQFCFDFLDRLPYKFSFHDQLLSMLILALGRVPQTESVVYFYDLGEWETAEKSLAKDRAMYVAAGLPPEIDRLHWLLCALEGGLLLSSRLVTDRASFDRDALTNIWFAQMFQRFRHHHRVAVYPDNPLNDATQALRRKWVDLPSVNLNELLIDVCDVLEVADPVAAQTYFAFWSSL